MDEVAYGVRELQAHLGEALRAVRDGKRVLVTSRGSPVAVILKASHGEPGEPAVARKLRRLAAAGRLRLGSGKPIPAYRATRTGGLTAQVVSDRR